MNEIERLKEYIQNDEIYQKYKKDEDIELSDFDKFCILHCADIEWLVTKVEHYEKTYGNINTKENKIMQRANDLLEMNKE